MQQLREAFPWDQAPRYLLRDRNAIYGSEFAAITKGMGVVPGQSLADPKPHSFGTQTPCTWENLPTECGRGRQSSKCNCQCGSQFIGEIRDQRATRLPVQTRTEFSVITPHRLPASSI
jgi:hypothetical protein